MVKNLDTMISFNNLSNIKNTWIIITIKIQIIDSKKNLTKNKFHKIINRTIINISNNNNSNSSKNYSNNNSLSTKIYTQKMKVSLQIKINQN